MQEIIVIANFISSISDNQDAKVRVTLFLCTRNRNFASSCVTYLDCVISLKVVTVIPHTVTPDLSCFTLHKGMKNSDSSWKEFRSVISMYCPEAFLFWGGMEQNQNQNEKAYLRSPAFSICSWGPCSLHAKVQTEMFSQGKTKVGSNCSLWLPKSTYMYDRP